MLKVELLAGCLKVEVELGSIVSLNILNLAVKQDRLSDSTGEILYGRIG